MNLDVRIAGLGRYLPERVVDNDELEDLLDLRSGWIKRRTGIETRRHAEREDLVSMMKLAAEEAMERARVGPEDLSAVITTGSVPHQVIPCTAVFLQEALGPGARGAACFDINATCLGFIMGMNQAALMIQSGQAERVLVATAEVPLSSGPLQPDDPQAYVLFGDAAAAVVLERSDDASTFERFTFKTFSEYNDLVSIRLGVRRKPGIDPGAEMDMWHFNMDGKGVYRAAFSLGAELFDEMFGDKFGPETLDVIIPHQTNSHGVSAYRKLGFGDKVYSNLHRYGNTVTASLPLALYDAIDEDVVQRGSRVALVGTAAGLSFGALTLTY